MRVVPTLAVVLAAASPVPVAGAPQNLYDWIAPAPIVLTGERVGSADRQVTVRVRDVLRGEVAPGTTIRVALRQANRSRDRDLHPAGIQLRPGVSYTLLLEPGGAGKRGTEPAYELVRGVQGVRALPAEGAEALVGALATLVAIQAQSDDRRSWEEIHALLERGEPLLIETALDLHVKFRRGDAGLIDTLRPLLEHPAAAIRERAAGLLGQILGRPRDEPGAEVAALRDELAARARRDPATPVRLAAVRALDALGGEGVLTLLDRIADDDPDQDVRLLAEALALERRRGAALAGED